MSHAFYNAQWQAAMEELSQQIEIENPPVQLNEAGKPMPDKSISWDDAAQHYCTLYLRYVSLYRKLEDCYDQMLHPQKRRDLKLLLEVVMARLCQVKGQCVKFGPDGRASDFLNLENYLLSLRMGPAALEVPIPRYYREVSEHDDHNKKRSVLEKCLEEHGMLGGMDSDAASGSYNSFVPKLTKEQAIRIIQKNERGRQGTVRAKLMKELRDEDSLRRKLNAGGGGAGGSGASHPTAAATLIQKVFRGHLVRMKVAKQTQEEFVFLGMKSVALNQRKGAGAGAQQGAEGASAAAAAGPGGSAASAAAAAASSSSKSSKYDPLSKELQIRAQRKTRQIDHELKYIESLVELQKQVTEVEGPGIKDQMWEERYQWWIAQKEATGKYPDNFNQFYIDRGEGEGLEIKKKKKKKAGDGEKAQTPAEKAAAKAQKEKEKAAQAARENTKQGQKKLEEERKAAMALSLKTLVGPTHLVNHMLECLNKYRTVWSTLDESGNYQQIHSEELAKEKLRPLIKEKIKKEVDVRLLAYLDNIRLKVAQRAAAKKAAAASKKGKKGKKGAAAAAAADAKKPEGAGGDAATAGGEGGKDGAAATGGTGAASARATTKKKAKGSKKSKGKKKAKKCCEGEKACAHMPLGDMISLLVKMGILRELRKPLPRIADLQGDMHFLGAEYVAADITLDPSMAQLRSTITESFVLPLGSAYVKEQAPLCNALLLYGPHGTGKTMLSKAIAAETNSCWFDLSPRSISRKLGTKAEIAKLVHMVFAVAAELAPSVIYMDEADQVFQVVKSKKNVAEVVKMKQFILTHKAMLNRQTRVLVVGNSRQPYDPKVDRKDLLKFFGPAHFGKMIFCPPPNYATRIKLFKHFILETGLNYALLERNDKFDLNTLAYISEGYSAGAIQQCVLATIPPRRVQKLLETGRAVESAEFVSALSKTPYTYKNDYAAFVKFTENVTGETERRRLRELAAAKALEDKAAEAKKAPAKKKKPPA